MKTPRLSLFVIMASLSIISGCQRNGGQDVFAPGKTTTEKRPIQDAFSDLSSARQPGPGGTCNPNAYTITLESRTFVNSNWEWIWSVQNPNPGNGGGGTVQNLSHWGMQFGSCFAWSYVVSAAYSADNITWTSFTPLYQIDPSQTCMTDPVLKFDYGTTGNAKSYYKLVISHDLPVGWVPGYYKSGVNTGCCIFNFMGIACPGGQEE